MAEIRKLKQNIFAQVGESTWAYENRRLVQMQNRDLILRDIDMMDNYQLERIALLLNNGDSVDKITSLSQWIMLKSVKHDSAPKKFEQLKALLASQPIQCVIDLSKIGELVQLESTYGEWPTYNSAARNLVVGDMSKYNIYEIASEISDIQDMLRYQITDELLEEEIDSYYWDDKCLSKNSRTKPGTQHSERKDDYKLVIDREVLMLAGPTLDRIQYLRFQADKNGELLQVNDEMYNK